MFLLKLVDLLRRVYNLGNLGVVVDSPSALEYFFLSECTVGY